MERNIAIERVQYYLDDRPAFNRLGYQWNIEIIISQLNECILSFVREFASSHHIGIRDNVLSPLYDFLYASLDNVSPGIHTISLPSSFLYPVSVCISGYPARIYSGGAEENALQYQYAAAHFTDVGGQYRCQISGGGRSPNDYVLITFIRVPILYRLSSNDNLDEFDEIVYEMIALDAARRLALQDDGIMEAVAQHDLVSRYNAYRRMVIMMAQSKTIMPIVGLEAPTEVVV